MSSSSIEAAGRQEQRPASQPSIYHERQEMLLCGLHVLNAVLQGPYFDELSLAALAQDLDTKEREVMAEAGFDSEEYRQFVAQGSANVANDGNFSIQVLTMALNFHDLTVTNIDSPDAATAKQYPQQEQAFICHLKAHWFAIRKIGGEWFDLNSLHAAPKALSEFYLSAFLATLKEEGWTVFVVRGSFPSFRLNESTERSRWFTPAEAKKALLAAEEQTKREEAALAAAQLAESLPQNGAPFRIYQGSGTSQSQLDWPGSSPGTASGWAPGCDAPSAPNVSVDDDLETALELSRQAEESRMIEAALVESAKIQKAAPAFGPQGGRSHPVGATPCDQASASGGGPVTDSSVTSCADGLHCTAPVADTLMMDAGRQGTKAAVVSSDAESDEAPAPTSDAAEAPPEVVPMLTEPQSSPAPSVPNPSPALPNGPSGSDPSFFVETKQADSSGTTEFVDLAVRLPSGTRIRCRFLREDCVAAVEEYIKAELGGPSFVLAEAGPRGKDLSDKNMTLKEAGIYNQTLLIVKYPVRA